MENLKMDKYYKITTEIQSVVIPLKLKAYQWGVYIEYLKGWIIVFEEDTTLELLHKHVLAQIVLRIDKKIDKLIKNPGYDLGKYLNINISIAEKIAMEYLIMELGIEHHNRFLDVIAQDIVNQLYSFDVNLPEDFKKRIVPHK